MKKEKKLDIEQNLMLSHFSLDNLHEGVFWIGADARILNANEMACKLTGYKKEELTSMTVFDLDPLLNKSDFEKFWTMLQKEKKQVFDAQYKQKNSQIIDVEISRNLVSYQGEEFSCNIVRDIREKKIVEDLLSIISQGTSGLVGQDFFESLTKFVTIALKVKTCIVTECTDVTKTCVRTLAYTLNGKLTENFEYDVEGTPCKTVMQDKGMDVFIPTGCDKSYPKEAGYDSYIAVPIYSSKSGDVTGHIAALDIKPMDNELNKTSILKIFSARAGAELDRIKAEEELMVANAELENLLKVSDQRYRDLFEEAPIAYVNEGLDSKFIKANKAALRILGVRPDELNETYGRDLTADNPENQMRVQKAFESIGQGTDTDGVIMELNRKDNGKQIWIQWWSNPDLSGKFTRTMFLDITAQVLIEQEQARLKAQNMYLREEIKLNHNFEEIVSKSKIFHKVLQQLEQVASTDATVLILGESGTGKELLARAVHNLSNRNRRPLIKVNCATLPANLIESELFGHEKGAFTGAVEKKTGRFELADGGTIFLDEIGDLPIDLQAKLLRVLQEGEFERLGNSKTLKVDVRVIAATNRKLDEAIKKNEFREDLYYRLNVFPIISPPLRDRKEDIPLLVNHFCKKYEPKIGRKINKIPKHVLDKLHNYHWPGNIRELENIIERALILSTTEVLEIGDWISKTTEGTLDNSIRSIKLDDIEKEHIVNILEQTNWKVSGEQGAAKFLGLNPTTLEAKMKKLGITRKK